MPNLILASGSPRRAMLLLAAGYTFDTVATDVDETQAEGEAPAEMVLRLSSDKAQAGSRVGSITLAADTIVVRDGDVLGKPADENEALAMLTSLSGRTHSVLTGWTILSEHAERFGVAESRVTFVDRRPDELRNYIGRTQPFDKAGAYALQSDDGWLVASVTGSRANVMGLPLGEVVTELDSLGVVRSAPDRG